MSDSHISSTLLDLCRQLERLAESDIIEPEEECPVGAEVLGVATPHMRRTWTLFTRLSKECDESPEGRAEKRAFDIGFALIERGHFRDTEFHQSLEGLRAAQKTLSARRTFAHLAGALFMAEAAQLFPSDVYVSTTRSTSVYKGWVIGAPLDDSPRGSEPAVSGFGGDTDAVPNKLN